MATIYIDDKGCLLILSKDKRDPTLLLPVDAAEDLEQALIRGATLLDDAMATSGKLVMPRTNVADVWDAKVGYFEGGVAIKFSQAGLSVPLPSAVAKELARRIRAAINAAVTGFSIKFGDGPDKTKVFGPRPAVV